MYHSKLIVLRGNSGSGKTTTAYKLREINNRRIALVEQDYIRRKILKEKENDGKHIALISQIVQFALMHNYDVILEGILYFPRYKIMFEELIQKCPDHHFYYFDIPFEETLRRHATKPNANEFGEKEMREWYKEKDITGFDREIIIPANLSQDKVVNMIIQTSNLLS
jgi:adenylate kinase family enzyme